MKTSGALCALFVVFSSAVVLAQPSAAPSDQIYEKDLRSPRNWPVDFSPLTWGVREVNEWVVVENAVPSAASHFITVVPCRVLDTRNLAGPFGGPIMAPRETRTYNVPAGPCPGIPSTASAYSLSFSVAQTLAGGGFLTAWPAGAIQPNAATMTWFGATQTLTAAAIVPAGTSSSISVYASQTTHVIIDINGYFVEGVVSSLNAASGAVTISGAGATMVSTAGNAITVTTPVDPGGVLPAGTNGQTLRHSGTAWVPNDALTSDGTDVTLTGVLVVPSTVRVVFPSGAPFLHMSGGGANTFLGSFAGNSVTTGGNNTSTGVNALRNNTTGFSNTANGSSALGVNVTGANNTASGHFALWVNTSDNNTAVGRSALANNTTGSNNIAIGNFAGADVAPAGSANIHLGSRGLSADVNTIRIGGTSQTRAFLAGVRNVTTGVANGIPVLIDGLGQLGTTSSSATVKKDIAPVGEQSSALMKLRPVSFLYRSDSVGYRQYGLIAEEVAELMPELVQFSPEGEAETVRYHFLAPLLLSEIQKQQQTIEEQRRTIEEQRLTNEQQRRQLTMIEARLAAVEEQSRDRGKLQ